VNQQEEKAFAEYVKQFWEAGKTAFRPEYHQRFRKVLMRIVRKEEKEYQEFVELMETSKEDVANKKLQDAAEEQREEEPVLHQCHYCGDMYPVSDLTGAKMGLICYKCRHEMENRD
jgi:hypothetical protein